MNILDIISKEGQSSYPNKKAAVQDKPAVENPKYKKDILDIFSEKTINEKDINDMVKVPRSIFKGYLCFTTGTALNAIAGMINKKNKFTKGLAIGGSLMSIYGTFNFVKPFLKKENNLTKTEN